MTALKVDDRFTVECDGLVHISNNDGFQILINMEIEITKIEKEPAKDDTLEKIKTDVSQVATQRLESDGLQGLWLISHRNGIDGVDFVAQVIDGSYKRVDISKLKDKSPE